ncbi:aspartate 1-decarboxylase [Pseudomonadota bacterium]
MQHMMLKTKLHRARVTHAELEYEGSCAIDDDLLKASGIREYEQIHIYNISNGERFTTYAIRAEAGSGIISINGAAARKASVNDLVIICSYVGIAEEALAEFKPKLIYMGENNSISHTGDEIPVQLAS